MRRLSEHISEAVAKRKTGKYDSRAHYFYFGMDFDEAFHLLYDLRIQGVIEECAGLLSDTGFWSKSKGEPYFNIGDIGSGDEEMCIAFGESEYYLRYDKKVKLMSISRKEKDDNPPRYQDWLMSELNSEIDRITK